MTKTYAITENQLKLAIESIKLNHANMPTLEMLQSLPLITGEPVAWHTEDHLTDRSATTYKKDMMREWQYKGWPITALYTHSQPLQPESKGLFIDLMKEHFPNGTEAERPPQPITAEDITDAMRKEMSVFRGGYQPDDRDIMAAAYNAVSKGLAK